MKRSYLLFIVALVVIVTSGLLFFNSNWNTGSFELIQFGVIALLVAFALWIGLSRFKSERRGEPAEDELSKKIMTKASSLAYFISIYMWLVIMYLTDRNKYETDLMFGTGILGMGVIFAVCWIIIRIRGVRGE
jgi:ABC-type transport system involved in multi-copper enzyme maturation permease subunit